MVFYEFNCTFKVKDFCIRNRAGDKFVKLPAFAIPVCLCHYEVGSQIALNSIHQWLRPDNILHVNVFSLKFFLLSNKLSEAKPSGS